MRRHLNLAPLVQESEILVSPDVHVDQMPQADVAVVADEAELSKSSTELDTDINAIDDAADVAVALEELAAALQGGDAQSLQLAGIASEHLCARAGMALEFIGPFPTDLNQGIQHIQEQAKRVWHAIVEALKKAWKWLKGHVMRLMDMSAAAKKRAEATLKRVQELQGEPQEKTFTNDRLAAALATDNVGGFAPALLRTTHETTLAITHQLEKTYSVALFDKVVLKNVLDGRAEFHYDPQHQKSALRLETKIGNTTDTPAEGQRYMSFLMLGGAFVAQALGPRSCDGWEALQWMLQTPQLHTGGGKPKSAAMEVLSPKELTQLGQAALALATSVTDFRSELEKLERMAAEMVQAAEGKLGNDTHPNGAPTGELALQQKLQRQYLTQAPRWLVSEPVSFANYGLGKANALLNYIERCMHFYPPVAQKA